MAKKLCNKTATERLIALSSTATLVGAMILTPSVAAYEGSHNNMYDKHDDYIVAEPVVAGAPRIRLSVTDNKVYALQEEVLTYEIVVSNTGDGAGTIDIRTEVPSQITLHTVSGRHEKNGRSIVWYGVDLEPGETRVFTVTGHIERDVPDFFSIRFKVTTGGSIIAADTTTVGDKAIEQAGVTVRLSDGQDAVSPGSIVSYDVVIENNSNTLQNGINVQANLPLYTDFNSASDGGYWADSAIQWRDITLPPHGYKVLTYRVLINPQTPLGSTIRAGVKVRGSEAFDTSVVDGPVPIQAPLDHVAVITKRASRSELQPGGYITYTLVVRNPLPHAVNNIAVTDSFDNQLIRPVDAPGATIGANGLRWTIPTLASGDEWTVQYLMMVNPQAAHATAISNTATVQGDGFALLAPDQKSTTIRLGVLTQLPQTGGDIGAMLAVLLGLLATGLGIGQKRLFA